MKTDKLKLAEKKIGSSDCTIDDITSNAAVILRTPSAPEFAAMNFDPYDLPRSYDMICRLVKEYLESLGMDSGVTVDNVEAIIIGGDFREHIPVDEGFFVYVEHNLTRRKLEEAFRVAGVRAAYLPTDVRATKSVIVREFGTFEDPSEKRVGNNKAEALKSKTDYDMTLGRYHDQG
ncbi:hypothetical protein JW898_05190 [Candidatus Woesearchaeota archaeon]|nr:hypothetical protein [Candidatus Woesearchaeota archaeon]